MNTTKEAVLIVGLGNPGSAYKTTRHNIGQSAVKAFGLDMGWSFSRSVRAKGKVAQGEMDGKKVYLLLPSTYMNESGNAVRKSLQHLDVNVESLLVITDDIYLPLGKFRLREKGTSGGHNGLKSVESQLGTSQYQRLRVGIDNRVVGTLEDYVLSAFEDDELNRLPKVIKDIHAILGCWLRGDNTMAKQFASSIDPDIEGGNHERNSETSI